VLWFRLVIFWFALISAACGPEPTPFPVDVLPEVTETPAVRIDTSTIRYALAVNTVDAVPDLELIQETAQTKYLTEPIQPDDLGSRYDIVAAYGDFPESARAPVSPTIALILQPTSPPLDNPEILDVLRRGIDTNQLIADLRGAVAQPVETQTRAILRADLANAGWPDGFSLILGSAYAPGAAKISEQFGRLHINLQTIVMTAAQLQTALKTGDVQLGLFVWTTAEERQQWEAEFGEANIVDLFTVPISYHAAADLNITFTPGGWPLVAR